MYCVSSINTPGVLLLSCLKFKCFVSKQCHSVIIIIIEDALLFLYIQAVNNFLSLDYSCIARPLFA